MRSRSEKTALSSKQRRINPFPGNGFFATATGEITPGHISSSTAHSDKIPTATPMFPGSSFLVVVLPISWDVDMC